MENNGETRPAHIPDTYLSSKEFIQLLIDAEKRAGIASPLGNATISSNLRYALSFVQEHARHLVAKGQMKKESHHGSRHFYGPDLQIATAWFLIYNRFHPKLDKETRSKWFREVVTQVYPLTKHLSVQE